MAIFIMKLRVEYIVFLIQLNSAQKSYIESISVPGLLTSNISDLTFVLIVKNFGVRYTNLKDIRYLELFLNQQYQTTLDLPSSKSLVFNLNQNYYTKMCILSKPNYNHTLLKNSTSNNHKKYTLFSLHSAFIYKISICISKTTFFSSLRNDYLHSESCRIITLFCSFSRQPSSFQA